MIAPPADTLCLLIKCPDRPGLVAAVSRAISETGANIVSSAQFSTAPEGGTFFLRMEFHLEGPAHERGEQVRAQVKPLAAECEME